MRLTRRQLRRIILEAIVASEKGVVHVPEEDKTPLAPETERNWWWPGSTAARSYNVPDPKEQWPIPSDVGADELLASDDPELRKMGLSLGETLMDYPPGAIETAEMYQKQAHEDEAYSLSMGNRDSVLRGIGFTSTKDRGLFEWGTDHEGKRYRADYDDFGDILRAAAMFLGHVDENGEPVPEDLLIMGEDDVEDTRWGWYYWRQVVSDQLVYDQAAYSDHNLNHPNYSFSKAGIAYIQTGKINDASEREAAAGASFDALYVNQWGHGTIFV